jgi:multidrug efflux pump subunit AcrB
VAADSKAVDEVGGPTILATFTVIAALLPMAFVSGLMGPYMSPIPINSSMGMFISLAVAFVVTPWLAGKLMKGRPTAMRRAGTGRTSSPAARSPVPPHHDAAARSAQRRAAASSWPSASCC